MSLSKALVALAGVVVTYASNLGDAGIVSEQDVQRNFEAEMSDSGNSARLQSLEDALRLTYKALPKNEHGNLGHEAVRYALHRMFIQRHGWFIKGLEPGSERSRSRPDTEEETDSEWVPSYLQTVLESRVGEEGASLHDLSALAAVLEDLVDSEARGRLAAAYDILDLPKDKSVEVKEVKEAVKAYYVSFLLSGNFSASSRWEALERMKRFEQHYTDWTPADGWMHDLLNNKFDSKSSFTFDEVSEMVESIGENYYKFNDVECRELKGILSGIEGIKAGRVRLSFFYQKGLHSHWRFNEKKEYLKVLGALDDSDPNNPQVILPNYIMARPNCLESSNLYAICCRNECEDLMTSIESDVGSDSATPARIADLVSKLPSDTVAAPRSLSEGLLSRLEEVALSNNGQVPLHGRLFAQWMHHAYPRECPYPHEASENPQTPDEWMAAVGAGGSQLTEAEMRETVEQDQCASGLMSGRLPNPEDCGDATGHELPWNPAEQLLVQTSAPGRRITDEVEGTDGDVSASPFALTDLLVVVGVIGFLVWQFYQVQHGKGNYKIKDDRDFFGQKEQEASGDWKPAAALAALACLAWFVDLLDLTIFLCTLLGSVGSILIQRFGQAKGGSNLCDDPFGKCCV
eukprot:CAMPEP_0206483836 /NCGR_PEP_ID=MMETSP0324_2-20121206/39651_1 /ASSEMBLY_ACC=CAM_ASM_000836 /TAXON_ID=2866 /ORGANISM="Crypthecodinium cohnii, Strain Seligo" /LENGTH=630 /DNA_ID=CAMNT_0053961939 /DNA_START=88 /DNA_END=1980 /DNA_ORIENTATION=+